MGFEKFNLEFEKLTLTNVFHKEKSPNITWPDGHFKVRDIYFWVVDPNQLSPGARCPYF